VLTAISHVEDESVQDLLSNEFAARRTLASSLADLKAASEHLASMRAKAEREHGELYLPGVPAT
jgi:hypothetical protein